MPRLQARAGFTLSELLIALLLTSLVGAAVTGVFVTQSRYFEQQEKEGFARNVARGAMNLVMAELRMIDHDSGLVAASPTEIRLRVPYAMGVVCDNTSNIVAHVFAPDSFTLARAVYGGYGFRQPNGYYSYRSSTATPQRLLSAPASCAALRIKPNAGGQYWRVAPQEAVPLGTSVFLYQLVTYRFGPSVQVPGRQALWRQAGSADDEELVAPFASTAAFRFFAGDEYGESQPNPPAAHLLSTVHGVELVLDGTSERPDAAGDFRTVPLRTAVFFKNRRS